MPVRTFLPVSHDYPRVLTRSVPVAAAVALAAVVVLTGCVGPAFDAPDTEPTPPGSADTTAGSDAATRVPDGATPTAGESTPTPTAVGERANPWGSEPVVVAVEDPAGTDREWAPLVREATAFWAAESERFAGFRTEYEVRPDAADPDLVIEFVGTVPECDGASDAAGSAPLLTGRRRCRSGRGFLIAPR